MDMGYWRCPTKEKKMYFLIHRKHTDCRINSNCFWNMSEEKDTLISLKFFCFSVFSRLARALGQDKLSSNNSLGFIVCLISLFLKAIYFKMELTENLTQTSRSLVCFVTSTMYSYLFFFSMSLICHASADLSPFLPLDSAP